ncbi:MAG: CidA/LrgA family protein [Rhodobacteraceae bacterium]|nr:CidA/LrgA family protein [Paracoccaceae bacterium]
MIPALTLILCFQLAGEVISRALHLPLPGPVLGMAGLLAAMAIWPRVATQVRPVAQGLLGNLSLLFVPAGVGVVGHLDLLTTEGVPLVLALVVSSVLAITVGALTFRAVARLTGGAEGGDD